MGEMEMESSSDVWQKIVSCGMRQSRAGTTNDSVDRMSKAVKAVKQVAPAPCQATYILPLPR